MVFKAFQQHFSLFCIIFCLFKLSLKFNRWICMSPFFFEIIIRIRVKSSMLSVCYTLIHSFIHSFDIYLWFVRSFEFIKNVHNLQVFRYNNNIFSFFFPHALSLYFSSFICVCLLFAFHYDLFECLMRSVNAVPFIT